VPVPESDTHDEAIDYLKALLLAWARRTGKDVKVARNLGLRWVPEEPRAGFDPDLCLLDPAPPADEPRATLALWEHAPPVLAIEVVSPSHPYKDYLDTPDRAAAAGISELWVYDPMSVGPKAFGGPFLLQVWRRSEAGSFERIFAGEGPAYSQSLDAWLHPQAGRLPSQAKLRISNTREGQPFWLTGEEQQRDRAERERVEKEQERSAKERERAEKEQERAEKERERAAKERERAAKERERAAKERERELRQIAEQRVRELEQRLAESKKQPL
jgi:Uma2 family endonuclease